MIKTKIEKSKDLLDLIEKTGVLYGNRESAIVHKWGNYWMVINRANKPRKHYRQYRWFFDNDGERICSVGSKMHVVQGGWYDSDSPNKYYIPKSRKDVKSIRNFLISIDPEAEIKVY